MSFPFPTFVPFIAVTVDDGQLNAQFIGSHSSTANRSGYTFSAVPVGDASANRVVVIGAMHVGDDAGNSVRGITVDGVSTTRIGGFIPSSRNPMGFFAIDKPTGTTSDIVVTFGVEALNCVIFVWTVHNAASLLPFSEHAAQGSASSATASLNVPSNGVALFIGGHDNANPAAWSDATQVDSLTVENRVYGAAELNAVSELVDHAETRSWSGSNQAGIAGVAFEPLSGAYPVLKGHIASATFLNNSATSFDASLPGDIQAGEMLFVVVSVRSGSTRTISTPAGWTEIYNVIGDGDLRRQAAFYRIADGSEGSSVTVSASGNSRWAASAFRIGNHTSQIEALTASGNSSTADPPSLSPSWGSAATLWLAVVSDMVNNTIDVAWPSGFSLPTRDYNLYLGTMYIRSTGVVRRQTTATLNPGAFALPGSNRWVAATIGIR